MRKIQIIADTGCDLPDEIIQKHNIHLVPVNVHFGDRIYHDRMEISAAELYQMMKTAPTPPTTSQINPDQYFQAFKEYADQDVDILVIGLSLKLTGSLQSAQIAKDMLQNDRIHIFDTKSASLGTGLYVLKAAEYIAEGFSLDKIIAKLKAYQEQAYALIVLSSLKHLLKSGRLSRPEAALGSMLNIKPILGFNDGEVVATEKVRSLKRALSVIIRRFKERQIDFSTSTLGIAHANCLGLAEDFAAEVEKKLQPKRIIINTAGAAIGAHVGQGGIGLFY